MLTWQYAITSFMLVLLFSFLSSSNLFSYISNLSAYGHGYFRIMWCSETFFSFSGIPVPSSVDCLRDWRLLGIGNSACSFRSLYTRMILRPGTLIIYSLLNANEKKVSLSLKLLICYFSLESSGLENLTTVAWYTCSCVLLPHICQNQTTKRVFNIIKDLFSGIFSFFQWYFFEFCCERNAKGWKYFDLSS